MDVLAAIIYVGIMIWLMCVLSSMLYHLRRIDKYCEWRVGIINKKNEVTKHSEDCR